MSSNSNQHLDRELDIKGLILFTVALTAVVVVMAVLMWLLSGALRSHLAGQDPPRPVLPAARVQPLPPEPRLQAKPEADLRVMQQEEDALLSTFAWVDESAGVAQVPIETAIDLLADSSPDDGPPTDDESPTETPQ